MKQKVGWPFEWGNFRDVNIHLVIRFGSELIFTPIKLTVSKVLVSKLNVLAITFWNVSCLEGC